VTGCSSGIGRCVAQGLREDGWRVFASARRPEDVAVLQEQGFEALRLDLADSDSIAAAVDTVLGWSGGRLFGLFNNGAYAQPGAVEDVSRAALRAQFEVNLFGTHELTCRVLPVMHQQGCGRIIQNSSMLGVVALKYRGAYVASKFALEGLTDTLRLELAGTGIHVALIEPGPIESRIRANGHAAFLRHIRPLESRYAADYAQVEARLQAELSPTPFTLPPDAVLRCVRHALGASRPRVRYPVTVPGHVFGVLRRLLPGRALDYVLARV
jgi:NAD(P)-dependent dehydrogenase (short-subunit alcohol dehydrogenase family)